MTALDHTATDLRPSIAELRRELDERTAERDEALAQQAATGEILSVISRSPADIQPVLEAIVARAATLCEAEFSAAARLEDGLSTWLRFTACRRRKPRRFTACSRDRPSGISPWGAPLSMRSRYISRTC